jgi:hypothetical protein
MAALLDIETNVNVIIIKIADVANLSILEIIPIEIKTFTGHNAQLVKICREINI